MAFGLSGKQVSNSKFKYLMLIKRNNGRNILYWRAEDFPWTLEVLRKCLKKYIKYLKKYNFGISYRWNRTGTWKPPIQIRIRNLICPF
jgi:hypothetical protein